MHLELPVRLRGERRVRDGRVVVRRVQPTEGDLAAWVRVGARVGVSVGVTWVRVTWVRVRVRVTWVGNLG